MTDTNFEPSDVWINLSKSGNGFTIKVQDTMYTGAMQSLERFVKGDVKGVNLSIAGSQE